MNAITRFHARAANIFSVTDRKLEPVHNHGSFFAGGVPVFDIPDLITTQKLGDQMSPRLSGISPRFCCEATVKSPSEGLFPKSVMMAIYLEEAAQVLFGALQIGTPIPLTLDESKKRQVEAFHRWTWSGRGTFSRTGLSILKAQADEK